MAEYIDRMAAKKAIKDKPDMTNDEKASLFRRINAIPAADVVEVVRCRDCKHYDCDDGDMKCVRDADWDEETAHYYGFVEYHGPDWFCAGGERKQ